MSSGSIKKSMSGRRRDCPRIFKLTSKMPRGRRLKDSEKRRIWLMGLVKMEKLSKKSVARLFDVNLKISILVY